MKYDEYNTYLGVSKENHKVWKSFNKVFGTANFAISTGSKENKLRKSYSSIHRKEILVIKISVTKYNFMEVLSSPLVRWKGFPELLASL